MVDVPGEKYPDNPLAAARLEKLNLEINNFKNRSGWAKKITLFTPLVSVVIAVGGFLFGIYQFQRQQRLQQNQIIVEQQKDRQTKEREQSIRIQNQIHSDIDQILHFTNDKQQTVSRVLFLLEDIKANLQLRQEQDNLNEREIRNLTLTLVESVVNDCDFEQYRDVKYATALQYHWADYNAYLTDTQNLLSLQYILGKYIAALDDIYDQDPTVIRSVRYYKDKALAIEYPQGYGKLSTATTYHFEAIIFAYANHLSLLTNESIKKDFIKQFQASTCNDTLAEQLLGSKTDRQEDPEVFRHCPRK